MLLGTPGPPFIPNANTTEEEDRHSLGQRRINLIWESTQAVVAVAVTLTTLFGAVTGSLSGESLLGNAFFLVIGFYFGRTNHQRIGGIEVGR